MITPYGKNRILDTLTGTETSIADTLVVGIGEVVDGENLGFEITRIPVSLTGLDRENNRIIFKGDLPQELSCAITEVGLYAGESFVLEEDRNINLFPGGTAAASWSTANTSVGQYIKEECLRVQSFTSVEDLSFSLDDFVNDDSIKVLTSSTTSSTLTLRVGNDASNYWQYLFNVSAGKSIVKVALGARTTNGSVNPSNLTYVSLQATASVLVEGIRFENLRTENPQYGLVGYSKIASVDKLNGENKEVEYPLTFNIGAS